MSKVRKTWTIVGAIVAGGVTLTVLALAGPIAEAGIKLN
jgi:hypothetical protein